MISLYLSSIHQLLLLLTIVFRQSLECQNMEDVEGHFVFLKRTEDMAASSCESQKKMIREPLDEYTSSDLDRLHDITSLRHHALSETMCCL